MTTETSKYHRDMGTPGVLFIALNGLIGEGTFGLPERKRIYIVKPPSSLKS